MADTRAPWRSVRVRITAAATVVVGLTMLVASFALVAAVRHQLVDKLEAQNQARLRLVAARIAAGAPPDVLSQALPAPGTGFVVVQRANGEVVKAVGAVGIEPDTILVRGPAPRPGETAGLHIESADTPFDVRYTRVPTPEGALTVFAGSPLDGVQRSIAALQRALGIGFPFLVALVGALAWALTGRALRPVEAMRAEVEAISGGTLHRRVPDPGTGDELSRLGRTMNAMLDRLEHASDRQRQFVSDASHELRNPVAAIRAHLEVGLSRPDDTDWPTVARKALDEEARLEALIADLLLLASVDEQAGAPDTGEVDLVGLARDEAARPRPVPVTVVSDHYRVPVLGRSERLGRVVANLLDNAARYASTAVTVTVDRDDNDHGRLIVDDDGPGIPAADRQRVFERFTRLDPSRARTDNGSAGLGLALAQAIVQQHGGTITIADAPGGGARMVVVVPAAGPRPYR